MVNPKDTYPQGDPDTVVLLPEGDSLVGLYIKGVPGQVMLGIREDAVGRPVSCAITNQLHIDTSQSNPRRPHHWYGYTEDDGA